MSPPPPAHREAVASRTRHPPLGRSCYRQGSHRRLLLTHATVPARFRERLRRVGSIRGSHGFLHGPMRRSHPLPEIRVERHPASPHRFPVPAQFLVQSRTGEGSLTLAHPSLPHGVGP